MKQLVIMPIRAYQYLISPMLGNNCRHVPSCSEFMINAIKEWGVAKGIWMGSKRLMRCHPWGTSGYDPVPSKIKDAEVESDISDIEESLKPNLQFEKRGGLLPVVVQESSTGQVLMLGYANREAFERSMKYGRATFWSTSRQQIWTKGETSGNSLLIDEVLVDCDQDAIIYKVTLENGGVCHTFSCSGEHRKACFYREFEDADNLAFIPGME